MQPGADEEVLFSLNTALGGNVFTVNNENVEYLNQNVRFGYDSATQTIVGFVDENVSNGTYEAGDHVVFRLTALPGGNFRFDLLDQLDHNIFNTSGTGDAPTLTIDLSGAIVATDFDGDVVNLGVDSIRVVVENDVPSLVVNPAAAPLVVDDTNFGADATHAFTNFFIVNPGADEPAVVSNYALQTTGGPSGLFDTLTTSAVVLTNEGGAIVGRASESGAEVFRVTVDASGNVTLNQSRAVVHNDPANSFETGASAAVLSGANLITLHATITDADNDVAQGTADLTATLRFEDDGPSIDRPGDAPTLTTDDTATPGSSNGTSFAGLFTSNFGNDGFRDQDDNDIEDANAIRYALGLPVATSPAAYSTRSPGRRSC